MLAIGNNEKCPWCDTIMTEEIDTLEHLMSNHTIKAMKMLFPISKKIKENKKGKINK